MRDHINFEALVEVARLGIRRASVFMGLGVNAEASADVRRVDLSGETKLRIVADPDAALLVEYKREFKNWVIANALREVHEGFTEYLEQLHQACLTIGFRANPFTPDQCDGFHKKFHRAGFPDKFKTLTERFDVSTVHETSLRSINDVRNCWTHRRGVVSQADLNDGSQLTLTWRALDIYIGSKDRLPLHTRDIPPGGVIVENAWVEAKLSDRKRSFKVGQTVELSPLELAEICFSANEAATELATGAVNYARRIGIQGHARPKESDDG